MMKMNGFLRGWCALAAAFALVGTPAPMQAESHPMFTPTPVQATAATEADRAFGEMLARLKSGSTAIDFTALRTAWTRTSSYRPNAAVGDEQPMRAAFAAGRMDEVLRRAEKVRDQDYLNIMSHMMSADAHGALGNSEARQFHVFVARGLIRSLLQSGDGLAPKTAYKVVSLTEIGRVLFFRSLRASGENVLVREGGRVYRKIAVKHEHSGAEGVVFFDVTPLESAGAAKPAEKQQ